MIGTTVILIRHAKRKELPGTDDPPLNPAGRSRAKLLIHVLGKANISAIYTSTFIRTIETAQPLATHLGIVPVKIGLALTIKNDILTNHGGKTVLVVGHSDSVPELINV